MAITVVTIGCGFNTSATTLCKSVPDKPKIEWDASLELPPLPGDSINIGVAGGYAGITDGKLILAGGANFPEGFPWTGAKKVWHRHLYIFDLEKGNCEVLKSSLPLPMAYGVSVTTPHGILFIGGNNSDGRLCQVMTLTIKEGKPFIDCDKYPPLPYPLANAAGALVDNFIYIAGGSAGEGIVEEASHVFLRLNLDSPKTGWEELPSWHGSALGYSVAAVANHKFYLFGGRDFGKEKETTIHTEGYEYDPDKSEWSRLDGEFPVMAGSAVTIDNRIYFFGGVDKILPTDPYHPGFPRTLRVYDPASGTLRDISESPAPVAVTTTAVLANDSEAYIVSGECRPGVRTPLLLRCRITQ